MKYLLIAIIISLGSCSNNNQTIKYKIDLMDYNGQVFKTIWIRDFTLWHSHISFKDEYGNKIRINNSISYIITENISN